VSDPVWERARNTGKTFLDVLEFQKDHESVKSFSSERNQWLKMLNFSKTIITPGMHVRNIVSHWVKDKEKIKVIKNSTDLSFFKGHSPISRQRGEPLRILFIGRLTNLKGLETLVLAINDIENVQLTICGDGPEYIQIYELNRQLMNENVDFLGRLSKNEIYERLKLNHVLILPSITEGLSHTLIDAIAFGMPCIASNVGGNPEVISDRFNGLLFPARDVNALKNAIIYMRDNEEERFRMALNAQISSKEYDMEQLFPLIEKQIISKK
jgi:glycosyltransferase involved in cell wall biosynthesis